MYWMIRHLRGSLECEGEYLRCQFFTTRGHWLCYGNHWLSLRDLDREDKDLMMTDTNEYAANRILALLPQQEAKMILPDAKLVEVHLGDIIDRPGEPIQHLFFPLSCRH